MADTTPHPSSSSVQLVAVNRDNYLSVVELCVAPDQECFVGTAAEAIADLHYLPGLELWAIQAEPGIVGLVLIEPAGPNGVTVLRRLLVDCNHQRRGYASAAIRHLAAMCSYLALCVHKDASDAIALYNKLGFTLIPRDCPFAPSPYPPHHHYAIFTNDVLAYRHIPIPAPK